MHRFYLIIILVIISGICTCSNAQTIENRSANDSVAGKNYNLALKEYLELYKTTPNDTILNYNIGVCYLHINDDKSKAIPYLEFVHQNKRYKDDLLFYLGKAYMFSYKFDEALSFFTDYQAIILTKKAELIENYYEDLESGKIDYQKKTTAGIYGIVDHLIENCEYAKELVKRPVNVTFQNLGKEINSKYPDYNPFITQNQDKLYFTSRRDENPLKSINSQGYFSSDIYVSEVKDGQWAKAKNMGPEVNSVADEQCVYVSPSGKKMIIFEDNENSTGDLFSVPLLELHQQPPVTFQQPVNTEFREFEGSITEDENMIFISSNRPGGLGETDLYMFNKLPNGNWGAPINLGSRINTKYKEAFPMYDEKNAVLYFASEGHTNMGGFDIFKSKFDVETRKFGPAENIGYPINTPDDDMVFSLTENKRDGYISAVINGGFGDLDIYKVVFNGVENRPSIIRGIVSTTDWADKDIEAFVSLRDAKTNNELDAKNVNPKTGRYVFAVEPGKYIIKASSPNFLDFEQEINVYDKSDYAFEIEENILLQKLGDSSVTMVENAKVSLTKPKSVVIRGVISTNDSLQKHIEAVVSILEMKKRKKLESKNANPQTGRYFFALDPGVYILTVTSPGFKDFEEQMDVSNKSINVLDTEKNIILQKGEASDSSIKKAPKEPTVKHKSTPAKKAATPAKKTTTSAKKTSTSAKKKK